MSRDDIIRMAREAGLTVCRDEWVFGAMLERFAELVCADEREAMMQLFTDPENQPTQYGTVTIDYMQREIAAEREACANDKQDAERYRHMRNNAQFQSRNGPGLYWYLPRFSDGKVRDEGQQLDDAIDAAIRVRGNT